MQNINYIRAAIEQSTGQRLNLEEVVEILLEENMITPKQAKRMIMRDYRDYYDSIDEPIESDQLYGEDELEFEKN